jgi:toxin ParE1/3/4
VADLNWTAEAERWLRDIYDYIAAENPDAAIRVVEGIYDKAQLLQQFPELGYRHEGLPDQHIRILLYGHYQDCLSHQIRRQYRYPGRVSQRSRH